MPHKRTKKRCDFKSANFPLPASSTFVVLSHLLHRSPCDDLFTPLSLFLSHLSFYPFLFNQSGKRYKLTTKVLKVRLTWKRTFPLFMAFSEFLPETLTATVTCLIYEKFPSLNLPSVKARIPFPEPTDRAVGISPTGDYLEKSIVRASSSIEASPQAFSGSLLDRFEVLPASCLRTDFDLTCF